MIKKVKQQVERKSLLDNIEEALARDNIVIPEYSNVDTEYLTLPECITDIEMSELGNYLNAFTQQKIWVRTVIGRTSVLLRERQLFLDEKRAIIFDELPVKMSVKEKELRLLLDPNLKKVKEELIFYEEKLAILEDIISSLEESIFTISREITRRTKDFDEFNRNENWGRRK